MAKKKNTLTDDIRELHRKLALANFSGFVASGSATRDSKAANGIIGLGNGNALITMAALVGIDTHEPNPSKVFAVSYGASMVRGQDAIQAVEEANGNMQADAISNGFEVMEKFVAKITAKYLYDERGKIPIKNKVRQRAQNRFGKKAAKKNTPEYFKQIVAELSSRNCDPLFGILFKNVDGLEKRVANYHYGDLRDIHAAVEQLRHCKTHANGRYDPANFNRQPEQTRKILSSLVRPSVIHGDDRFLPNYKQASDLLAREAEFGQILYEEISETLKMKIDYRPN